MYSSSRWLTITPLKPNPDDRTFDFRSFEPYYSMKNVNDYSLVAETNSGILLAGNDVSLLSISSINIIVWLARGRQKHVPLTLPVKVYYPKCITLLEKYTALRLITFQPPGGRRICDTTEQELIIHLYTV